MYISVHVLYPYIYIYVYTYISLCIYIYIYQMAGTPKAEGRLLQLEPHLSGAALALEGRLQLLEASGYGGVPGKIPKAALKGDLSIYIYICMDLFIYLERDIYIHR